GKSRMAIAGVYEWTSAGHPSPRDATPSSGIRSFSLPAVFQLTHSHLKSVPKGYGLEIFLNSFFPLKNKENVPASFTALLPFRVDSNKQAIETGRAIASDLRVLSDKRKNRRFRRRK
ncbi:MAG: hypothetical protein AABY11_03100, partial [archaeon]